MVAHQRQSLLAAVKDGIDIDRKAALPIAKIALLNIARNADPGIVYEDIEAAQIVARSVNRRLPIIRVGHIMLARESRALAKACIDKRCCLAGAIAIDIGAQHARALFCKAAGMGPSKALRSACYQRHFARNAACFCFCNTSCHHSLSC